METTRINGYLYQVEGSLSGESNPGKQNEELSAEEYLAANGIKNDEIRKIIIEAE